MSYNTNFIIKIIIISIILIALVIFFYMYNQGAVNKNIYRGVNKNMFSGITIVKIRIPPKVMADCLKLKDQGKRVVIPNWKGGETVPTTKVTQEIINFYHSLTPIISKVIGEKVYPTELNLPTTCAILTYNQPGDFINWHYDVNYFKGRFFTVLMLVSKTPDCDTKYEYKDENGITQQIDLEYGDCLIFEGPIIFHSASGLGKNQSRSILSMQYSTDPTISWFNRMIMRLKDIAYVG